MTLYRGRLASRGSIAYAAAAAHAVPQLKVAWRLDVTDLATRDNVTNDDFVSWHSLQIDDLHYQLAPDALQHRAHRACVRLMGA